MKLVSKDVQKCLHNAKSLLSNSGKHHGEFHTVYVV